MGIFLLFYLVFGSITLLIISWYNYCNIKTSRQRTQIIDWVFAHKNYSELRDYYDAVSYDQHQNALMRFKNPYKLYDPDLFSTFHMIKHGPSLLFDNGGRKLICPYAPE